MASYQPVQFTSPGYDYGADVSQIERRRAMAQMLQQQGMQPVETPPVAPGQFATPISPWQEAAKLAQVFAANRQQQKADTQQRELATKSRADLASVLTNAQKAASGTPATPISEDASGNVTPAQAAIPGDMSKAASIYMSHPLTAQLGAAMMQKDIEQQQRQKMMASILGGQGAPAAPAYGSPGFAPQGAPAQTGPMAGLPPQVVALMTSGDPELQKLGTTLAENYKVQNVRPEGTVYQPGVGPLFTAPKAGVQTQWGPQGPTAVAIPNAQELAARGAGLTAGAQEAGKAPYQLREFNLQPTPTVMTQQQAIERATGQPMPTPGSMGVPQPAGMQRGGGFKLQDQSQSAANTEAGKEFIAEMRQNYAKLRDVPATLANIERGKQLAAGSAAQFMGPFGESKLALTKFFRGNVPGMETLNTEGVKNAEELQSTLFNQVMDNLKKMDAQPSQYQQQVMQEAFGTLRTDPSSVPRIMDVFSEILRNRVAIHNETVKSAESRGTSFPYDISIKTPAKTGAPLTPQEQEELKRLKSKYGR